MSISSISSSFIAFKNPDPYKSPSKDTPSFAAVAKNAAISAKEDVVQLSPQALDALKKSKANGGGVDNKSLLSESTQRTVSSFTSRIKAVLAQFKGAADNEETRAKIHDALKEAGLLPEQLRLTDPNNVRTITPQERERRLAIIGQFNDAYNSWRV